MMYRGERGTERKSRRAREYERASIRERERERVNENKGRRGTSARPEIVEKDSRRMGELILSYSDEFFEGQFCNAGILD